MFCKNPLYFSDDSIILIISARQLRWEDAYSIIEPQITAAAHAPASLGEPLTYQTKNSFLARWKQAAV